MSCPRVLADARILAQAADPVTGPGGCGIAEPLLLRGFVLPSGRKVMLEPPALMRCGLADRLTAWVIEDLAPALQKSGGQLGSIANAASYDCRGRNRIAGAQLSEHGKGNAIDIRAFRLANGAEVQVSALAGDPFMTEVSRTACSRFTTVLGPGSDPYHKDHLHLDLAVRRNGSHYCQWPP